MAKFFLKSEIDSTNDLFYFLKNGGIIKKKYCKVIGKRVYPMDRQYFNTECLREDDCVHIVGNSIHNLPKKYKCSEVIVDELFEPKTNS